LRLSVVSLQANGETVPKLGHHDFLQNHLPIHIYLSTYHMILPKRTKNKELKLSEGNPIKLVQG
jgi:hypothetical protein